ncbi:hypothetical protein [Pseudomonas sp. LB3P38]|uniref:hypothetical protein n=1 Tax=Pseudomonas lyxosi TaxID=3398358 RepID=UPI0039EDF193
MAWALNKNKKPESKIKKEHATTFLGSFGSPCSFCRLAFVAAVEQREAAFDCRAVAIQATGFF